MRILAVEKLAFSLMILNVSVMYLSHIIALRHDYFFLSFLRER